MENIPGSRGYEYRVVTIMFLAWGFIFLDRTALSYIVPALVEDLSITNSQVSQVVMWQTIGFAIVGPILGILSDKTGKRKNILIAAVIATSIFSALSAFANSFTYLLFIRFLVGAAEGPILPLAMTMVASVSTKGNFGRNAGIVNAGVAVIATTLGPLIVTQFITLTNWRWAFILVGLPSLVLGFIIWKFTAEARTIFSKAEQSDLPNKSSFFDVFKYRNVNISIFISICCMAGLWILYSFAPLYLTSVSHFSIAKMGFIMSLMGILQIGSTIIVPLFSDYYGRKTALVLFSLLAVLAPLGLYIAPSGWIGAGALIIFGGLLGSIAPIFQNIIPSESVPLHLTATSSAIIIGIGEILGSIILGMAGTYADSYGLTFMMIVASIAALVMAVFGLFLKETNKRNSKVIVTNETAKQS